MTSELTFKDVVNEAIKRLIKQMTFRKSKKVFIYNKIIKELSNTNIRSYEDLEKVKYVKGKIYEEVRSTMELIIKKNNIHLINEDEDLSSKDGPGSDGIEEIKFDFNHLSSNLSDLEIKYGIKSSKVVITESKVINDKEISNTPKTLGKFLYEESEKLVEIESVFSQPEIIEISSNSVNFDEEKNILSEVEENLCIVKEECENNKLAISEGMVNLQSFLDANDNTSEANDNTSEIQEDKLEIQEDTSEVQEDKLDASDNTSIVSSFIINKANSSNVTKNMFTHRPEEKINKEKLVNSKKDKISKYIPLLNSAPYLLLKILYRESSKSCNEGLHRYFINSKIQKEHKLELGNTDKDLKRRGLIGIRGNKMFLEIEGVKLCERLFPDLEINKNDSELKEDNQIYLIIDSREKASNKNRIYFQDYFFNKAKITKVETRQLEVGDFIWIRNEKVLDYCIERKTIEDFRSSVFTGRLFEQLDRIKKFDFRIFYLIETGISFYRKKSSTIMGEPRVKKILARLKQDPMITVIETEDISESAKFIHMLHDYIISSDEYLTEVCGYGTFLEDGDKSKKITVSYVFINILEGIKYCTKAKAKIIGRKYFTASNFIAKINKLGKNIIINEISQILEENGFTRHSKSLPKIIVEYFSDTK